MSDRWGFLMTQKNLALKDFQMYCACQYIQKNLVYLMTHSGYVASSEFALIVNQLAYYLKRRSILYSGKVLTLLLFFQNRLLQLVFWQEAMHNFWRGFHIRKFLFQLFPLPLIWAGSPGNFCASPLYLRVGNVDFEVWFTAFGCTFSVRVWSLILINFQFGL